MGLQTASASSSSTSVNSNAKNYTISNVSYSSIVSQKEQNQQQQQQRDLFEEENNTQQYLQQQEIIEGQGLRFCKLPNVPCRNEMAPALTEPLSQTNKLSSSTTSASPRPTSNSLLLLNNNNNISNHNSNNTHNNISNINNIQNNTGLIINNINNSSIDSLSDSESLILLQNNSAIINNNGGLFNKIITTTTTATSAAKQVNNKGDFQQAFEEVVARQTAAAAAAAAKQKRRSLATTANIIPQTTAALTTTTTLTNDPFIDNQMGPMCDNNITENIINLVDDINVIEQQQQQQQELGLQQQSMDYQYCEKSDSNNQHVNIQQQLSHTAEDITPVAVVLDSQIIQENILQDVQGSSDIIHLQNQCADDQQVIQTSINPSSPRTEIVSHISHQLSPDHQPIPSTSSLTPQSTSSSTMGLQKDFNKDTADMEQALSDFATSDIELLQVLKGFDSTPGGEAALCDLAGSLGLFNDVDVMNYEEIVTPTKDAGILEIKNAIEAEHQKMYRKCDFLVRRLKKIQARYMARHTSEEISGLFEWANRIVRRKDPDHSRQVTYEDEKHRPVSTSSMKAFLRRVDAVATAQHSSVISKHNNSKIGGSGRTTNTSLQADASGTLPSSHKPIIPIIPSIDERSAKQIEHVSGLLLTEMREVQATIDSDVTASSSGGESADEMVTYNNQMQQPLSISKRAGWRWARDRAAIASRWTWLQAQISDLEYRIRQHNELHHQIKKNKGAVTFDKVIPVVTTTTSSSIAGPSLPSSVNGYRGILPGNTKPLDTDTVPPNGAYDSTSNNTGGSCRTRPFQRSGFRKRKLLQTANVHTVSKKAARPSTVKCGCQWPLHPCALCTGRSDPTAPRDLPDTMPASERVALLDPGFHPVLSFPEDVSNTIHVEATANIPEWQKRIIRCSTKAAIKGAIAAQKAALRAERSKKYIDGRRKHSRKFTQEIAANKLKNAKNRRPTQITQYSHLIKSKHYKPFSSNSGQSVTISGGMAGTSTSVSGSLGLAALLSGGSILPTDATDQLDAANGLRSKNSSPTPGSGSGSSHKNERMDRRSRTSYDIDNIVIPYSVAAATRVEILPYKEIPTPQWRIVDDDDQQDEKLEDKENKTSTTTTTTTENTDEQQKHDNSESKKPATPEQQEASSSNNISALPTEPCLPPSSSTPDTTTEEVETEDISPEAIQQRHERALLEERRKFQTYLKFPWSTRSRANRRIDSRAESSGANTPDPTSPAPNTPSVGGDHESIPSPAAPSTPQMPIENIEGIDSNATTSSQHLIAAPCNPPNNVILSSAIKKAERRRTFSARKDRDASKDEHRRSNSPDTREIVPPFEPLQFPIPDDLYESMLQLMPNDHQLLDDCSKSATGGGDGSITGEIEGGSSSVKEGNVTAAGSSHIFPAFGTTSGTDYTGITSDIPSLTAEEARRIMGIDSDTDSAESGLPDDPNDPEWCEPA